MTALYRAYRPQRFDDVVGQESVVRTLRNAIASDRVAHAYLFVGGKGTGKTTMAKLLAKAMNCEQGPTIDPCGVCESCVAIGEGRSIDVAEIDAASNNGIDAVREKIIDTVAFQPASGSRRVYILDESHMLTTQAFNALLKTIEEPPAHVLFIFCTTETHKMMATVRDRCQRMVFAPPAGDQLLTVLARAADAEGIAADEAALRAIARVSQGSFRNALGTLELLSTAFEKTFSAADVISHLGAFSEEILFEVVDAVIDNDVAALLTIIEGLVQQGSDLSQFASELAEHLRCVLVGRYSTRGLVESVGDLDRLVVQAQRADETLILAAIDCLGDAVTRIRIGTDARIAVEVALVRACQGLGLPALALRLARLEHSVNGSYGGPITAAQAAKASTPAASAPRKVEAPATVPATKVQPVTIVADEPAAKNDSAGAPLAEGASLGEFWQRLAQTVSTDHSLNAVVSKSSPVELTDTALVLATPTPMAYTDKLKKELQSRTESLIGRSVFVEVREAAKSEELAPESVVAQEVPQAPDEKVEDIDFATLSDAPVHDESADGENADGDAGVDPEIARREREAEALLKSTFNATELPTT